MKTAVYCALLVAATLLGSGCRTYVYRVVQPSQAATAVIGDKPVTVRYEPLEYRFQRYHDRLLVRIANPTDERIIQQANRSYLIDVQGESHPLRGRVVGPHSYSTLLLPPQPITAELVGGYAYGPGWWGPGWGWGWGWGPGVYDGFYGGFYGPPVTYYQVRTPYDWQWKEGSIRLRLNYDREGKTFEHNFEIVRERKK